MSSPFSGPARANSADPARGIRRHIVIALIAIVTLFAGIGGWGAFASIAGAVVAPGVVVVEGNIRRVQHRTGGIVGEIHVRDGDRVEAGDVVVTLDATVTRANLAIIENQIDQLHASRARLVAERDAALEVAIPESLAARLGEVEISELVTAERALFKARRDMRERRKEQLDERVVQIGQEVEGLAARRRALDEERALIVQELDGIEMLYAKGLIPFPRIAELRRARAQLAGEDGQIEAAIAQAQTRIVETRLEWLQYEQELLSEVLTGLRESDAQLRELRERRIAAHDELARIDIRAPQNGIVHELAVHTVEGVISAEETIMAIVPDDEQRVIEARIAPEDIDQALAARDVVLRLSAFNQRTTPEIAGVILTISADLSYDPHSEGGWYRARIGIPEGEWERVGDRFLVPGMPVEAFIQTGMRTPLSYLVKPLTDHLARAFREE
ncbi:MAG: HlyD family type I secretion periplasmic adaptor subunit [Salinarimonas sp.]|nr:HlyD family type I secretion periplasmic adaptor subunit [Salinarimonas sp.]